MAARRIAALQDHRPLATSEEVAAFLRIENRTLENWRSRGKGPTPQYVGRLPRYRWPDVEEWLRQQKKTA